MPNAKAKGRGRIKLGETGQSITPRPLERRVGPRAGDKAGGSRLLLFAFIKRRIVAYAPNPPYELRVGMSGNDKAVARPG